MSLIDLFIKKLRSTKRVSTGVFLLLWAVSVHAQTPTAPVAATAAPGAKGAAAVPPAKAPTASASATSVHAGSGGNSLPTPSNRPLRLRDYNIPGMETTVDIDSFAPLDLVTVLGMFARQAGLKNVIISGGVSGQTARLKLAGISVADALDVVLSMNNLAYQVHDSIIEIMTDAEYTLKNGSSFYDQRQVEMVDLKYADPQRVVSTLDQMNGDTGLIVADTVTGTLILIDRPEKIKAMKDVIARTDVETSIRANATETRTFPLQYAEVDTVAAEVTQLLTEKVGSIRTDKRTKTIMVTDLPGVMKNVSRLVAVFDRKPKQVFIEAKVVEVSLSDDYSMGINWDHLLQGVDPRFSLESISTPGLPATPAGELTYKTIVGGADLTVVLEALKSVGKTEIISNPHLAVTDGQEAKLEVVEDQPYREVQFESGTTNITGVTYQFKKVGVQLSVTPRINDDEFITIDVQPEISSISQWYDGAPQEGTPVIKKALAQTTVVVKDGVTVIIGGLIQDRKDTSTTQVPLLGSIPVLGRLFRYDSTSLLNTETVIFLTPRITNGEESTPLMRDTKKASKPLRTLGTESGTKATKPVR